MAEEGVRDRLARRVPPRWDGVTVGDGWLGILDRLDRAIAEIDPDYEIHQAKEKFGGLRYYCSAEGDDGVDDLIDAAEGEAALTCENCGTTEDVTSGASPGRYWIKTYCDRCRERRT